MKKGRKYLLFKKHPSSSNDYDDVEESFDCDAGKKKKIGQN